MYTLVAAATSSPHPPSPQTEKGEPESASSEALRPSPFAERGRLAQASWGEVSRAVDVDKLFRTVGLHVIGRRAFAAVRPEVRAALEEFGDGVNAYLSHLDGDLPVEFTLLRHTIEPFAAGDFAGLTGMMSWGLNPSWRWDPLYEGLVTKVGPKRAAELFPFTAGNAPEASPIASRLKPELFHLGPSVRQITDMGDPGRALGIIPTDQSGIPASPHYNDLIPLWREGRYVPLLMDRQAIEKVAAARQVLRP